jgi:hypothetical protein
LNLRHPIDPLLLPERARASRAARSGWLLVPFQKWIGLEVV